MSSAPIRNVVRILGIDPGLRRTGWGVIDVEGNRLKPAMDRSFPLEEAAAAHALMESGDHVGKIVLTIG